MIPLSLYIHFPWCLRKCPYCDFNSHEARGEIPETAYLAALIRDIERALPSIWGRTIQSIFIGGGTPSLMSAGGLEALLESVRARLPVSGSAEITLEANPGAIEASKFAAFCGAGVNRLSLGIQSFDDLKLKSLGRVHDGDEASRAVDLALRHFARVNLDLMYGLPTQTLTEARHDLAKAIASGAGHISAYHLTVEPNTAFHQAPPTLPDDDLGADMQEVIEGDLAAAGYGHYETSAFAKPGQQCRHNLNYWTFGDYLGVGAGAHGKLSYPDCVVREMRRKHPTDYLGATDMLQESHEVGATELPGEFMMNALRLIDGFPVELFEERTRLPLGSIKNALMRAESDGLLTWGQERITPSLLGQRHLNTLIGRFF